MKIVKLLKSDMTNFEKLLKRVGLVDETKKQAYPERILVNENTYKEIKKSLIKEFKKKYPGLSKNKILWSANFYLLDLSPSVIKNKEGGKNLRDGHAIVLDEREILNVG